MSSIGAVARFSLSAVVWSLSLFAALRLAWIEHWVVQGFIHIQRTIAVWYGAPPTDRVIVDISCSGVDVMALGMAVCVAYPVRWRVRIAGALGVTALVTVVNTVRIGSLLLVAERTHLLNLLHVYVWPLLLIATLAGYVWAWIRLVAAPDGWRAWAPVHRRVIGRFGIAAAVLLTIYGAAAPWTMTSVSIAQAGVWTAAASGRVMAAVGFPASSEGPLLITARGVFQITPECLLTPLLPLYVAAVLSLPITGLARGLAIVAGGPIFFVLAVLRGLVLALPSSIAASPLVLAHGFHQLVMGAAIVGTVCVVRQQRHGHRLLDVWTGVRFLLAAAGAVLVAVLIGPAWHAGIGAAVDVLTAATGSNAPLPMDVQGAVPLLPVFQLWLIAGLALAVAPALSIVRLALVVTFLAAAQVITLVIVDHAPLYLGMTVHTVAIRAAAIGVPLLIWWLLIGTGVVPRGVQRADAGSYRQFWNGVGDRFPDLHRARSTTFYREDEIRLLSSLLPPLTGRRLLKTDLWDEAKNTRILQWAAESGAHVYGIDIAEAIVRQAWRMVPDTRLRAAVGDVRRLPFADASFDVVYSMGTIEHFPEAAAAVLEMARVLTPGGRLVVGVPNRHDPFLRPALAAVLQKLGLYAYGFERSFSRRALRAMLEDAGLQVQEESGILFLPGWLRMLDLLCHTRGWRRLERLTAMLVALFAAVNRRFPTVRRHGYLLATLATRPLGDATSPRSAVDARPRLALG